MKRWLIGTSLAVLLPFAWALPSEPEVEAQVRGGHYEQAESMMQEVVAAKPQSAKAHYIYAEILAHNARFTQAAAEEARARAIDPSLKFSDPAKVRAFDELLDREQRRVHNDGTPLGGLAGSVAPATAMPIAPQRQVMADQVETRSASPGLPRWVWLLGLIALAVVAWRMLRRSAVGAMAPVAAGPAYGMGNGYGPAPMMGPGGGSTGSGLMGMGVAAAGGVAAGMLAEKLLERGHESRGGDAFYDRSSDGSASYDADARALEDRSVDFGNGGDWGDGGGSADVGGGGGSDDGSW